MSLDRSLRCFAVAVGLGAGLGCSLVAATDRNLIPGEGGGGAALATFSTTGGGEAGTGQGAGGIGGGGATGGKGGSGGSECTVAGDCGSNECMDYACNDGMCSELPKVKGSVVTAQTLGDCK